jgi:hypothetical protein
MDQKKSEKKDKYHTDFQRLMERWTIPRLAGSQGSYKIVDLLKEDFNEFNLHFREQKFSVYKSDTTLDLSKYFLNFSILFSGFLIFFSFQLFFSIPFFIVLLSYASLKIRGYNNKEICKERLNKEKAKEEDIAFTQSNLIYYSKTRNSEAKWNIILMAHHDSKSQTFPTKYRVYLALSVVGLFILLISFYVVCFFVSLFGLHQFSWVIPFTFFTGWINVVLLLILSLNNVSNKSPGALDDASGLYTLWRTAQELEQLDLKNSNLYLVLSGAEEIGQIGAADFLNAYREELDKKDTILLNFEMIGLKNKPLEIIDSYSFPRKKRISPSLLHLADESAKKLQYKLKKWYLPIGANTDGILFYKEGFNSLNFVSKEAGKYTHLPKDQYSLIDPSIIEKQVDLNLLIIKKLDNMP